MTNSVDNILEQNKIDRKKGSNPRHENKRTRVLRLNVLCGWKAFGIQ